MWCVATVRPCPGQPSPVVVRQRELWFLRALQLQTRTRSSWIHAPAKLTLASDRLAQISNRQSLAALFPPLPPSLHAIRETSAIAPLS